MPGRTPLNRKRQGAGGRDDVFELLRLLVAYVKQETVVPVLRQLKSLGKGLAGALLLALGTLFLGLGFLRALQTEFGGATGASGWFAYAPLTKAVHVSQANAYPYGAGSHLSGDLSWVPYMGGALFCLLVAAVCGLRIMRGARR